jgi:hypothetical protein
MLTRLLRRLQRRANAMGGMMQRAGVDPAAAAQVRGGAALAEAARRCRACGEDEACAHWLAHDDAAHAVVAPFCPNAQFMRLAGTQQASWPPSDNPAALSHSPPSRSAD